MAHDLHNPAQPHRPHHAHETPPLHDPVDPWHDHSHDQKPQPAHAEVGNARAIMGIGLALFMVIVVAVISVYAYYSWYVTQQLSRIEVASSRTSPMIQARDYRAQALARLANGGRITIPAAGEEPASTIEITPIDRSIERIARDYAASASR